MPNLFNNKNQPLATKIRPRVIDEIIGQEHLLAPGKSLRKIIEADEVKSIILFGPAGTGKTTIAEVISHKTKMKFVRMNATNATVKDIRKEGDIAQETGEKAIILVDEIHRFSKTQQDVLLPFVESGDIILIGATTENPFFSINSPLISRSLIFQLEPLTRKHILKIILRGIAYYRENGKNIALTQEAVEYIVNMCCGDGRKALTILEMSVQLTESDEITLETVQAAAPSKYLIFSEDQHFDLASAYQGSLQASDADAAIYWLAKWLESGEDPRYIARRILISAAEDAFSNPLCTAVAHAAYRSACDIGRPECDIVMAQATIMIAQSERNKTAAKAIWAAVKDVKIGEDIQVPKSMKDSHYPGAKHLGHGQFAEGADPGAYVGVNKKYV
jgi:putative ATPase